MFPLLKFSNKKIEDELENSFVNINFSSTTIGHCTEYSIYSFDQWKDIAIVNSIDPLNKRLPIYYVNKKISFKSS